MKYPNAGFREHVELDKGEFDRLKKVEKLAQDVVQHSEGGIFEVPSWLIHDLEEALKK